MDENVYGHITKHFNVLNIKGPILMPSHRKLAKDSVITFDTLIEFKAAKYIDSRS